jgi:MFS family permease
MTSPSLSPDTAAAESAAGTPASGTHWTNPKKGFLFFLGFAAIGAGMANLVPAVLTLSIKAQAIDPKNATTILSIAVAVGALVALVAFPVFGRISDRLRGRLGRRRPFLILGAVLFAIGVIITFAASTTLVLTIGGIFTTVGFSAVTVAVTAIIPDQFEPNKRGPASAIVGLSLPLGAVIGLFIAQAVSFSLALMFYLPAGLAIIGVVLFAIVLKDPQVLDAPRPKFGAVQFFSTFWVNPVKHPPFAFAWFSRLLLFFGVAAVQAYQAFYLIIVLHFDAKTVAGAIFLSTLVLTVFALVFAPIAGKISDRVGRRKPFVIAAAVIFGIGLFIVTTAHSYPAFLIAIAIIGIGQGVYFAVDLALVSQILPDPTNPAKDMGIIGLASSLPSSLVPAIAPALLAIGASATSPQNFNALFITGAIAAVVGALLIIPIRSVK